MGVADDVEILPGENEEGNGRRCLQTVVFSFLDRKGVKKCYRPWVSVVLESNDTNDFL